MPKDPVSPPDGVFPLPESPNWIREFQKTLHSIEHRLSDLEVRMARIEERMSPIIKVVYGIVSLGMVSLGGALLALVLKK